MSKFDAVIAELKKEIDYTMSCNPVSVWEKVVPSYQAAIRVLEAAAKVVAVSDNSVLTLDTFWGVFRKAIGVGVGNGGVYEIRYRAIRHLLEALPSDSD